MLPFLVSARRGAPRRRVGCGWWLGGRWPLAAGSVVRNVYSSCRCSNQKSNFNGSFSAWIDICIYLGIWYIHQLLNFEIYFRVLWTDMYSLCVGLLCCLYTFPMANAKLVLYYSSLLLRRLSKVSSCSAITYISSLAHTSPYIVYVRKYQHSI